MAIILCGKTASGKDTICRELLRLYPELKKMVSYTTRPMRENEENGVTYNFISDADFETKKQEDFFLETTEYNVASGEIWKYGSPRNDLGIDTVAIFNPVGWKKIRSNPDNITFYLKCSEFVLANRLIERGDRADEAKRRLETDRSDFDSFEEKADFVIRNDMKIKAEKIAEVIYTLYRGAIR